MSESVISKIKRVVTEQWQPQGVAFRYLSLNQANKEVDTIDTPLIMVECPDTGTLTPKRGRTIDRPTLRIWFLQPMVDADVERELNDIDVQYCKELAAHFIKQLNESRLFAYIPEDVPIPYVVEYCIFDRSETGIGIDLTLEELEGINICGDFQPTDGE